MQRQQRRDTLPELAMRRLLHGAGLRYRVAWPVPGMPRRTIDVAFTKRRVGIFIDGCFWHGCPVHGTLPRANGDWWAEKIARNQARDRETTEHLSHLGWTVLRVWEHEAPAVVADRVTDLLGRAGGSADSPRGPLTRSAEAFGPAG
jgi:DNA mismatch endonuclease (patch repair protein)